MPVNSLGTHEYQFRHIMTGNLLVPVLVVNARHGRRVEVPAGQFCSLQAAGQLPAACAFCWIYWLSKQSMLELLHVLPLLLEAKQHQEHEGVMYSSTSG